MRFNDCTTNEGYVALQAWLVGQLDPRTRRTSLHRTGSASTDAFLSVLVGTGLGFADYDDNCTHHGFYAFDFFVGDVDAPSRSGGADGPGVPRGRAALPGGRHPGDVPRDCRHVAR